MTDDKVKEAVERLRTAPLTIVGTLCIPGDLTTLIADHDTLQAERDKLSAENVRLASLAGSYKNGMEAAEAKLTALVEAARLAANALEMVRDFDGFVPPLPKRRSDAQAQESQILEDLLGAVTRAAKATRRAIATTPTSAPVEDVGGLVEGGELDETSFAMCEGWARRLDSEGLHGQAAAIRRVAALSRSLIQPQGEERLLHLEPERTAEVVKDAYHALNQALAPSPRKRIMGKIRGGSGAQERPSRGEK